MSRAALALMMLVAWAPAALAQNIVRANPKGLMQPRNGSYSQVVRAGNLVFVAGQTGLTVDGKVVSGGMKEQAEQAYANVLIALKSQGADFSNVVRVTTYVTNVQEYQQSGVGDVRRKYAGSSTPASALLQVAALADPELKIEIEVTAVLSPK